MPDTRFKPVGGTRLRSNPDYEIVPFDRLEAVERAALSDVEKAPDAYGVLRPRRDGLSFKSVSRDAALLFYTLQTPGALPDYFRRMVGDRAEITAAELVLDGLLEIEAGGAFVSGPAAYSVVCHDPAAELEAETAVARLSLEALRYADALRLDEPAKLSARIYMYNRAPATPRLRRLLPSEAAVAAYLGFDAGRIRRALDRGYRFAERQEGLEGWQMWTSRTRADHGRLPYKLYVSPRIEQAPEVFHAAVTVFARHQVARFKVGNDLHGLLRPDKLVAYLDTAEAVMELVEALRERLRGTAAHGVPFTAEVGDAGLLSWGMDPPRQDQVFAWQERTSWRVWLANRLAAALIDARAQSAGIEPWRYALERVRLEGVDPTTWMPRHSLWHGEQEGR